MTENKNEYDKLRQRSQRKDRNVYKTFVFVCHHSIQHDETFAVAFPGGFICQYTDLGA